MSAEDLPAFDSRVKPVPPDNPAFAISRVVCDLRRLWADCSFTLNNTPAAYVAKQRQLDVRSAVRQRPCRPTFGGALQGAQSGFVLLRVSADPRD